MTPGRRAARPLGTAACRADGRAANSAVLALATKRGNLNWPAVTEDGAKRERPMLRVSRGEAGATS